MKFKIVIWALLAGALGYFVLITPDNPVMRVFRGEISDVNAQIIIGPYPVEKDFEKLKKNGVGTIVSLLDPAIPYENNLIEQEKALAQRFQITFRNFPMISILGHKMGMDYDKNAAAAAEFIAASKGKAYVHCYLGIHRVMVVKKLLEQRNIKTGRYTQQEGERNQQALELDKAEQLYNQGYYAEAQNVLDSMSSRTPAAQLLYAWVAFRQGNIAEAKKRFVAVTGLPPESRDKEIGLGYCELRDNQLPRAVEIFSEALKAQPENEAALSGMGITLYRQGKYEESVAYLEKSLHINPENQEAAEILKRARAGH